MPRPKSILRTGAALLVLGLAAATTWFLTRDPGVRVLFLHHSTGRNVMFFPAQGVPAWFDAYNAQHPLDIDFDETWYPPDGSNMPADYHALWLGTPGEFERVIAGQHVVVVKHCYPASAIVAEDGKVDPSQDVRTLANYQAYYRALREKLKRHEETLFVFWTLPPLHPLAGEEPGRSERARRAQQFSEWLANGFLTEDPALVNATVFDVRSLWADPATQFLKAEYQLDPKDDDSHPNAKANDLAGPAFAQFLVDAIARYRVRKPEWVREPGAKD